ncbi:MAG: ATP-binding protein [Alphaproteobacteria bacterium]|nr:ATP-binding protein [Alphaproteobacteria bacterium]
MTDMVSERQKAQEITDIDGDTHDAAEADRIAALRRYAILDTDAEPAYDRIVNLAAKKFGARYALVSLVDVNRQWFKAVCGLDVRETERSVAFCATAIQQDEPLVVRDTLEDERFRDNPFVTGRSKIRFYAGAPLITPDGYRLGTLCVLDTEPRWRFADDDVEFLQTLAAVVVDQLEMRRLSGNVLREIESRVAVKGNLDIAESQIRQFIEFVPLPVAMVDKDMRYIMASRSWHELYRLGPEPVTGKNHYDLFPALPDYWKEQHRRCLAGETIAVEKDRAYGVAGEEAWVRRLLRPWRKPDGEVGGLILFNEDISERVRMERRLAQSQKMEAVGQLTGGVAHDFNNLMGVVMGNLQLLQRQIGDDPKAAHCIESALQAVGRGAELTKRLLAFSRRQKLEKDVVDLNSLLGNMTEMIRQSLGGTILLDCRYAPDLEPVETDIAQCEAAILNLAVNARDAMPEGGTLVLETAKQRIDSTANASDSELAPGDYVVVTVRDDGTGIPPDLLEKVFDPFFTTKEIGKGTGLGLSIVFGFMQQTGGHVRIESVPDRGTAVHLHFPVSARPLPAEAQKAEAAMPALPLSGDVLLVEDREDVREVSQSILEDLGVTVHIAAGAEEALALLRSGQPLDAMVTDIVMPGKMDGLSLAEMAGRIRPTLPVIFTSGYADAVLDRPDSSDISGNLLTKPYAREEIAEKLKLVFDLSKTKVIL